MPIIGQRPRRTFYVAFGHDEEVGGDLGAKQINLQLEKMLQLHGERMDFVLDEGLFVMKDMIPGTDQNVINIGVVEKGQALFLDTQPTSWIMAHCLAQTTTVIP